MAGASEPGREVAGERGRAAWRSDRAQSAPGAPVRALAFSPSEMGAVELLSRRLTSDLGLKSIVLVALLKTGRSR